MEIDYISDTHNDFWLSETNTQSPKFNKQLKEFINILEPKGGTVLIIAGDLGHYFKQDIEVLKELKRYYKTILLTFGNHDLYLISKRIQKKYKYDSSKRLLEMKNWCKEQEGIHYMDGDIITIDNITFAGVGMFWDGSYGKKYNNLSDNDLINHWKNTMNDNTLIFQNNIKNYSYPLVYKASRKQASFKPLEFFKKEKEKLNKIKYCDVIFSHYGPKVPDNLGNLDNLDLTTSFYYFDGSEDIERIKPKIWIYGHIHIKVDELYKGCNLLCNPLGYKHQETGVSIKQVKIFKNID